MKNFYLMILLVASLLVPRAAAAQDQTVWNIIQTNPNTLALSVLLQGSELIEVLDGPGPITVLAPSTTAIASLPPEQIAVIQADTTGATQALLLYHLVGGAVESTALTDGLMAETLQGGSLTFGVSDEGVTVNGIPVVVADLIGSNGVVHVIGGILSPPMAPVAPATVTITFWVDANNITVAEDGMFLSGSFNEWGNTPMTDAGNGTYYASVEIAPGTEVAYKFKNGADGWEEGIMGDCVNADGNRVLTVPAEPQSTQLLSFNACEQLMTEPMPPVEMDTMLVDLTFVVDPSQVEIDPEGMLIAGSFNGWTDGAMTLDAETGLWTATVGIVAGEVIEYKFKNGPAGWENGIVGACTEEEGNRILTVPAEATTLSAVCFNSCFSCGQAILTVTVDMSSEDVAPEGVLIAGSFNGWTDGATTDNGDGTYTATIGVDPNSTVEYKFKNGPDGWEGDFSGDCSVDGNGNRVVMIGAEDVTVGTVCFNSCSGCEKMVTFTVDMSDVEVAAEGVFLAGSFNEFADMPMMDNGDGTWTSTMTLGSGESYEYKFKNGPDGWEEVTGSCITGFSGNREVQVGKEDITLPTVCFSSCVGCGLVGVTFNVDMSQEKVDVGGVRVAGSFSEWTDVVLTDVGNGIWSGTVGVMPNDTIEFKYKNGPEGWEGNIEGECAGDNGNRTMIIADMDASVMQTCFNSCDICMIEPDPEAIGATSLIIENSCLNDDGTLTIRFDYQYNCLVAPGDLSGMSEIGFHSGANNWSSVVAWDDSTAVTAVNNGNDVFEVTIDPVAYYGLGSIDELENIMMVFNQGPGNPEEPWASEGKAKDGAGVGGGLDGACDDIIIVYSELRNCADVGGGGTETATSASLSAGSCVGEDGTVTLAFDLSKNCDLAEGSLAGMDMVGFHSGANNWSSVVEWNGDGAVTAMNNGSDVYSLTIDPAAYYGIPLADLENIIFVLNQGPSFPDDPWASAGRDQGDGECVDLNATISELPTCAAAPMAEVQDLPLTFESDNIEYQLFGFGDVVATRIDNPDPSGNGSSKVLSMEKPAGAQPWAGVAMPVATVIDLSSSPLMFVRVWSPRADVPFLLKIEDTNSTPDANGNPSVIAEVFANTTVANAWETLVFDMSTHPDFNAANAYNQVVFFADMNNPGVGETFYVDNIATQDLSTSTVDLVVTNELKVAPNPFQDHTLVTWSNPENSTYQVSILNITGQIMRRYNQVSGETLIVTKDDLISGMYFLNFRDEVGNMGTLKLMIE